MTLAINDELFEKIKREYPEVKFMTRDDNLHIMDISSRYVTDDPCEEALCWFNNGKGCILGEDKPFDCNAWPLCVMRKDDMLVIALSPECPVISSKPLSEIQKIVDDGAGARMFEYAEKNPAFIHEYTEGWHVLKILKKEE